jgi:hypothetical protein
MPKELIPERIDKLILLGRKRIFINYNKQTILYYKIYALDIYKIIISSNMDFFENTPGSTIKNY